MFSACVYESWFKTVDVSQASRDELAAESGNNTHNENRTDAKWQTSLRDVTISTTNYRYRGRCRITSMQAGREEAGSGPGFRGEYHLPAR